MIEAAVDGAQAQAVREALGPHGGADVHADAGGPDQQPHGNQRAALAEQHVARCRVGFREQADHPAEKKRIEKLQGSNTKIAEQQDSQGGTILCQQSEYPTIDLHQGHAERPSASAPEPFAPVMLLSMRATRQNFGRMGTRTGHTEI